VARAATRGKGADLAVNGVGRPMPRPLHASPTALAPLFERGEIPSRQALAMTPVVWCSPWCTRSSCFATDVLDDDERLARWHLARSGTHRRGE